MSTIEGQNLFAEMLRDGEQAARELGLPANFLFDLVDESDWIFSIKLYALLDGALELAISKKLTGSKHYLHRKDKLNKICSDMVFDGRVSKLSFAEAFGILSKEPISYLRSLSRLRNAFAHDVRSVSLNLSQIIDAQKYAVAHRYVRLWERGHHCGRITRLPLPSRQLNAFADPGCRTPGSATSATPLSRNAAASV